MPPIDWTTILEGSDIPTGWVMAGLILSNVLSFFVARGSSKDKADSSMLQQTVLRQTALDKRQNKMFDELQDEFTRVRSEMGQIRQELAEERKRFMELSQKYTTLTMDNHNLRQMVENLRADKMRLVEENREYLDKNRQLTDDLVTKMQEIEELREP